MIYINYLHVNNANEGSEGKKAVQEKMILRFNGNDYKQGDVPGIMCSKPLFMTRSPLL